MSAVVRAPHWAGIEESTFVVGIRFLCLVERWLGRWPFRLCLYPVVLVHWLLNRTARQASREYLARLQATHAPFPRAPGRWLSLRHFACFAETLLDKLLAAHSRYPVARVRAEREVMLQQIARGEGGVIVTGHIGCLELCQALADTVPGFRLTALVHTAHANDFNRLLKRLNPDTRVELLQVTELDAAMAVRLGERVAAGEFVAITGDRVPVHGGRSVFAGFLGRPAPFPVGPYVLAAALGCPLFAMACTHEGDGYRLRFERFSDRVVLPRGTRDAALAEQVAHFAGWLEAQVRHSPLDWFNFFPFWDQVPHDPASR
ncbi:acyltransferase [Aerolutibacter ruishenii]|uniref:Putative LPLAT superfamily acyltransferase n=1 Tax=Aerolutibacter ruishenii TaxID=686800 RepID=A0A562M0E1_9GAMM|nr:acyltransferase [Lysobacter ruishenii]TWI13313.1 putative LPLAT superfamily acyltransferase [Lysobacter ruishenii]